MTITYTWGINTLERETADGFVYTAHYTIAAKDEVYSASAYGSIGFERPEVLIPYDQLTAEMVIEWVKEAIGGAEKVAEIEASLAARINEKHQPTKAQGVPWQ